MTVKFFAYLREKEFAGTKELVLSPPPTVGALGEDLSRRFGPRFRGEFFSPAGDALGEKSSCWSTAAGWSSSPAWTPR